MNRSEAGKLGAIASQRTNEILFNKRVEDWNENPKLCKFCEKPISYEKRRNDFCNHSCGANYSNQLNGYILSDKKVYTCLYCTKEFSPKGTKEHKYCSKQCMTDFWWQQTKNELITNGFDTSYNHLTAKRYLIELHSGRCQMCSLDKWLDKPIALVLDHINGNSSDGSLSNLRVICNNCDATTPTYKAKNKGNGRAKRRERYHKDKSN